MTITRHYVLAAGGTGGHMMPAYALGQELIARGHHVALVTDHRGRKIPGCPDKIAVHELPAGRLEGGLLSKLKAAGAIWRGRKMAMRLYDSFAPSCVVGFGGYPAAPALLGAFSMDIPTVVHEQNAVLGRVNRMAAGKVNAIATAYPDVQRIGADHRDKVHLVGNPVRAEVMALRDRPFPVLDEDGVFHVLVTGGSQGASILSEVVPTALSMLPVHLRRRLQVTQQCREEDIERVRDRYADNEIPAELATYMPDLPERLGWSHLVIGRAGASTIAELTVAGRPAILIPLPSAMDDHQSYNVVEMVKAGGARAIRQPAITTAPVAANGDDRGNKLLRERSSAIEKMAGDIAKQIQKIAMSPDTLGNAAKASWNCGRPNAVSDLADLVESFGAAPIVEPMKTRPAGPGAAPAGAALARTVG